MAKAQFPANLIKRLVQDDPMAIQDDHAVDQAFKIPHHMGRQDKCFSLLQGPGEHAPESSLGRDIQTVGRFVKEQIPGIGGKGKCRHRFFLLSMGHSGAVLTCLQLEFFERFPELCRIVSWVKTAMDFSEFFQG